MNYRDHVLLWNQAFVQVMDLRHTHMEPGTALRAYRLPSSAFIYIVRGSAIVGLDGESKSVERFHVLHGGKGTRLDIEASDPLEYYLILYKANLSPPCRQELVSLLEKERPFGLQYDFKPGEPLALFDPLVRMEGSWLPERPEDKLYAKALFYRFVHELLRQFGDQRVAAFKPDPVAQAVRYLHENYKEPITLESLAGLLDCHPRHLQRLFKSRTGTSPIDYLIRVRMDKAKELLLTTDFALKDIAEGVGYADSYYFGRLFKKTEGVSPIRFKDMGGSVQVRRHNPFRLSGSSIAKNGSSRYIVNEHENHYQLGREGVIHMQWQAKSRALTFATLLLGLSLLLGACGAANNSSATGSPSPSSGSVASPSASSPQASASEAPRVVKHAMGEETLVGTPKRVVILTNEGTEALLAVGIKPVGAVQSWIGDPWYDHIKDEMEGVTAVGDELQPNVELIASLEPDLIIGNKVRQEKIYEQLKAIAPTVFAADLGGNWKVNFELYSEAVNKKAEGEKAMADFDKRVEEVKAKLGDKAATKVSLVRFSAAQVRIYQKQTFAGVLLNQLGIARPEAQDKDAFIEIMTKENIPNMDGDVMFYFVSENPGSTDASKVVEEWMNDPLFKNLSVAKNNKVIQVDEAIWNTAGGYEAANLLLDELIEYFEVK
ncbi:ABC transporter substrate-binding protein [Cohnella sp.]|uniref:ABC transporter substrate-binding protein n=1 Tax=Cohnella sp. TaxID=1883426 RepID=UPI003563BA0A